MFSQRQVTILAIRLFMLMNRLLVAFLMLIILAPGALGCKVIIAMDEVTAGDYNLMLKVRDPSRPGLQVLWKVEPGYQYDYHTPWTGQPIEFTVKQAFLGVTTRGDTPPNIFKPGMALSDAGIAYADADLPSYWINPSPYAWDDFDWIRYACQNATTEQEGIELLVDAVDMHATDVPENLFLMGPHEGYVIEATAFHYDITNVDGIVARSNYPKRLWDKMVLKNLFVASSFDRTFEGEVRRGRTVRLGAPLGVRLINVYDEKAVVRQIPFGKTVTVREGMGAMVGFYWVEVLDCIGSTARMRISYRYYAWENALLNIIQSAGPITPADMMKWSRLHNTDLGGMRGMCEAEKKSSMIFQIPIQDYRSLSMGWFAPDQCSAIYVPIHIANTKILPEYMNGEAAELSLALLDKFGHGNITYVLIPVETVFIYENEVIEKLVFELPEKDIQAVLTASDTEMQRQAVLMQNLYLLAKSNDRNKAISIWNTSYEVTLDNINDILSTFNAPEVRKNLCEVAASIACGRANVASIVADDDTAKKIYQKGTREMADGDYSNAVNTFYDAYTAAMHALFNGKDDSSISEKERQADIMSVVIGVVIAFILFWYLIRRPW